MTLFRTAQGWTLAVAGALSLVAGCATATRSAGTVSLRDASLVAPRGPHQVESPSSPAVSLDPDASGDAGAPIMTVGYSEPVPAATGLPTLVSHDPDDPFAGYAALPLDRLLDEVRQRNPTLQVSLAAWAAASERYPQVVALDDPMLQSMFAPGSFPSASNVQSSYFVGVAQKVPWWGKRELRGQVALSETSAAAFDSQDVQLRLAEAARIAFFDYYLVARELELNDANRAAMQEFRSTAQSKYESNQVTQQDVLQADVELARLESRQIALEQDQRVAVARINTLLHRAPEHPLPPPPLQLGLAQAIPPREALQQTALEQRPDLAARAARIQAEQSAVTLACKEFYPDFEFMGRYDQFWFDVEQRPQVGLNVNVPLNQSRRKAAVREALFRVSKLQAEYDQQVASIRHDVEAGLARVEGSRRTVALYADRILPASRANVESATSGYIAGTIDFLRLIEAQRELIELQEKEQQAIAEDHRRRAELERVVGAPL